MHIFQKQTSRNPSHIVIGLSAVGVIAWLTHTFPPYPSLVAVFFVVFAGAIFNFSNFLLSNSRSSLLVTAGATGYMLLRYVELREPIYFILLLASLISLELTHHTR